MNRSQKSEFVTNFAKDMGSAQAFALMSFNKITVEQMTALRLTLSKQNVKVRVVKNTLAKKVFNDTPYKDVSSHIVGPTMIAYSEGDPIAAAKAIYQWIGKENFELKLKGGAALGQVMSDVQLKALSALPGRNELYVSFLWALKSSPTKFLYALQDAPRRLGYALVALKANKEKQANG